ncbi:MAG: hypothetical protein IPI97_10425 [Nitrosomonas sp.]|nr:hypothetical protein [Nitrosomonas sp.]
MEIEVHAIALGLIVPFSNPAMLRRETAPMRRIAILITASYADIAVATCGEKGA